MLHLAARTNQSVVLTALVNSGADLNATNIEVLLFCVGVLGRRFWYRFMSTTRLFEGGKCYFYVLQTGYTALMIAAKYGRDRALVALLDLGADKLLVAKVSITGVVWGSGRGAGLGGSFFQYFILIAHVAYNEQIESVGRRYSFLSCLRKWNCEQLLHADKRHVRERYRAGFGSCREFGTFGGLQLFGRGDGFVETRRLNKQCDVYCG